MNKNYFSDITDLFLKVKNEENIQVDENAKAQIKQMLQTKISEMKHVSDPVRETYEEQDPKPSIWSAWRFQLLGVPVSLFAVVLIVFAASNLNVSIPKEDFSPTREEPEVQTTEPKEFDRPLVKTAPGLMVIDFSQDTAKTETRALNKITETKTEPSTTTTQPIVTQPEKSFEKPQIDYATDSVFVLDEPDKETVTVEEVKKEEVTIKTGGEEILSTKVTKVEKVENPLAEEIVPDSLDAEIPVEEPVNIKVNDKAANPVTPAIIAPLKEEILQYPVYTYRDEALKAQPAFAEEKLAKLTSSKTPESVTVYYVKDTQVVVEIEESGITKWYLFDYLEGTWTISKYEKFLTESVLK